MFIQFLEIKKKTDGKGSGLSDGYGRFSSKIK